MNWSLLKSAKTVFSTDTFAISVTHKVDCAYNWLLEHSSTQTCRLGPSSSYAGEAKFVWGTLKKRLHKNKFYLVFLCKIYKITPTPFSHGQGGKSTLASAMLLASGITWPRMGHCPPNWLFGMGMGFLSSPLNSLQTCLIFAPHERLVSPRMKHFSSGGIPWAFVWMKTKAKMRKIHFMTQTTKRQWLIQTWNWIDDETICLKYLMALTVLWLFVHNSQITSWINRVSNIKINK